jgi:hypothetical protein
VNDLARLFEPDEARDMLRKLGGLLVGLGLFMVFIRKSDSSLGGTWGDWGLLIVLLLAFAFLYGMGMLGRLNTAGLRPWEAVYIVFGVLIAPFVLFQFVEAVNGTPGASLNVFWIFLVTGGLAAAASLVAGVGYTLLLASLALIVSWSALWNKILSDGITAHYGVYRGLLLILAALLLGAALAAYLADRDRGRGRANEVVTGAAVSAVLAGAISFTKLFSSPFFNPPTAESAFFWELVLLAVSLLAIAYGTRLGSRGTTYVGGIGLFIFLIVAGSDINDATPAGKIVGWPLVLVVGGLLAFAASLVPGLKATNIEIRRKRGAPPPS